MTGASGGWLLREVKHQVRVDRESKVVKLLEESVGKQSLELDLISWLWTELCETRAELETLKVNRK